MNPGLHALVVDDQEPVRLEVKDRLEALGHTCCLADSSQAVEQLIDKAEKVYDYVVLDLEIPIGFGRPPMIQIGMQLIEKVRSRLGTVPIVIITSHGSDSPDLAIEALRGNGNRANDFVTKPFPDPGKGRTLEMAIADLLAICARNRGKSILPTRAMDGGELVFYTDRVMLEGVHVAGEIGETLIRRILDLLREKDIHGRFVRLRGAELAKLIEKAGLSTSEAAINGAVRDFRKLVTSVMLSEANLTCTSDGVIETGSRGAQGYRMAAAIRIRVEATQWTAKPVTKQPAATAGNGNALVIKQGQADKPKKSKRR